MLNAAVGILSSLHKDVEYFEVEKAIEMFSVSIFGSSHCLAAESDSSRVPDWEGGNTSALLVGVGGGTSFSTAVLPFFEEDDFSFLGFSPSSGGGGGKRLTRTKSLTLGLLFFLLILVVSPLRLAAGCGGGGGLDFSSACVRLDSL